MLLPCNLEQLYKIRHLQFEPIFRLFPSCVSKSQSYHLLNPDFYEERIKSVTVYDKLDLHHLMYSPVIL